MNIGDWTEFFEGTKRLPRETRDRLLKESHAVSIAKGKKIFGPDKIPDNLLFLVEGNIRVAQTSEGGREIVLYRVEAGQSCVLTTACMLAEEAYNAEGISETDVIAVTLRRSVFDILMAEEPAFRRFVLAAYSRRMVDLLRVVDEVAFGAIDVRLAGRLIDLSHGKNELVVTHQTLASELGTAREVISRQLSEFHRRGWIEQSRGRIRLTDIYALKTQAEY